MTRASTTPWLDVGIAFASGTIIQIPYIFANQVTDPSCLVKHLNDTDQISLTILCPCEHDENDVLPICISTHDCPDWILVEGWYETANIKLKIKTVPNNKYILVRS